VAAGVCPCCHQPVRHERFGTYLPPLKAAILDAIKQSGDLGIGAQELIYQVYRATGRRAVTRASLKAHVWQLNERLAGTGCSITSDGQRQTGEARYYLHPRTTRFAGATARAFSRERYVGRRG
jgi:hypothetical protein